MEIKNKIDKYLNLDEEYHSMDNILDDITVDELQTMVFSNIPSEKIDIKMVIKQFEELLKSKVREARYIVKKVAPQIVKEVQNEYK